MLIHRCSLFLQVVQKLTLTCVSGETPQNAIRNSFVTVGTEVIRSLKKIKSASLSH